MVIFDANTRKRFDCLAGKILLHKEKYLLAYWSRRKQQTFLNCHLDHNLLWDLSQYGFRKNMNTLMALSSFYEKALQSFAQKLFGIGFFLDIQKAFDSVNHAALLRKLPCFGITGILLKWFTSYLSDRSQFLLTPQGPSSTVPVLSGVPQGSVLGPLLFNMFVNDLPTVLKTMWPTLFADDTNLFSFHQSIPVLIESCSLDLQNVLLWFNCNKLLPNSKKSLALLFASPARRNQQTILPPLPFLDSHITVSRSTQFLGLHINDSLTWNTHVDALTVKIARLSGLFYLLRSFLPVSALLVLYNALVLPRLSYGIELWGSSKSSSTYLHKLFLLQKRLVRLIGHSHRRSHTAPLFSSLKILPLFSLHRLKICLLAHKIVNDPPLHQLYGLPPLHLSSVIHSYSTRSASSLQLFHPSPHRHFTSRSLYHKLVDEWSVLPEVIRRIKSRSVFKQAVKTLVAQQTLESESESA
eukprot:Pompholyxophrys_punicea_v1_NODE_379_length_2093_cov_14.874387.p1 type:complete len:468 gc:universal NODE_379_length_2093_cov_14.874387:1649-246(-)